MLPSDSQKTVELPEDSEKVNFKKAASIGGGIDTKQLLQQNSSIKQSSPVAARIELQEVSLLSSGAKTQNPNLSLAQKVLVRNSFKYRHNRVPFPST